MLCCAHGSCLIWSLVSQNLARGSFRSEHGFIPHVRSVSSLVKRNCSPLDPNLSTPMSNVHPKVKNPPSSYQPWKYKRSHHRFFCKVGLWEVVTHSLVDEKCLVFAFHPHLFFISHLHLFCICFCPFAFYLRLFSWCGCGPLAVGSAVSFFVVMFCGLYALCPMPYAMSFPQVLLVLWFFWSFACQSEPFASYKFILFHMY